MKTSELSGVQLDWAVAKCEGVVVQYDRMNKWYETQDLDYAKPNDPHIFYPSTDWDQGGPIIEREKIRLEFDDSRYGINSGKWESSSPECAYVISGETALIAAMRCYVASKLGDEVEIPKEVTNEN